MQDSFLHSMSVKEQEYFTGKKLFLLRVLTCDLSSKAKKGILELINNVSHTHIGIKMDQVRFTKTIQLSFL